MSTHKCSTNLLGFIKLTQVLKRHFTTRHMTLHFETQQTRALHEFGSDLRSDNVTSVTHRDTAGTELTADQSLLRTDATS
jgi:hypothetical protein